MQPDGALREDPARPLEEPADAPAAFGWRQFAADRAGA
jgi:hypothetical protein